MPNCYTLTKKGEKEPTPLVTIDEEMCAHFQEPCDPEKWLGNWNNTIGMGLAMGHSWDKMRGYFETEGTLAIIDYLEERYDANAWYQGR